MTYSSIQDPHKYGNMHMYFQTRSGWFLARQVHPPLPWQIGKNFSVSKPPGTLRRINQERHQSAYGDPRNIIMSTTKGGIDNENEAWD